MSRMSLVCGLNGETMAFRQKSPDRVIAGARRLLLRYPTQRIGMVDNILPHSYFRTVLPRLAKELPPVQIFYETKSNLNLEQVQQKPTLFREIRCRPEFAEPRRKLLRQSARRYFAEGEIALDSARQ